MRSSVLHLLGKRFIKLHSTYKLSIMDAMQSENEQRIIKFEALTFITFFWISNFNWLCLKL